MATKKEDNTKEIKFENRWKSLEVTITGIAPLAMQNRPVGTILNLSRKDNGLPTIKYKTSDMRRFIDSIHWIDESKKPDTLDDKYDDTYYEREFKRLVDEAEETGKPLFYIPCEAFKESICKGAYRSDMVKDKVSARSWFIIRGDKAPITYSKVEKECVPTINKNAKNAMVISVYSKFYDWETKLNIDYNEALVSAENLLAMICVSGLAVGVLARRTELSFGKYGTYTVKNATK